MLRLLRTFKQLWLITKGMIDSMKTIFWVSFLLLILLYCTSIMATQIIGQSDVYPGYSTDVEDVNIKNFNNYQYFGTIPRSMFTLFAVVLLAEYTLIIPPVVERQPLMLIFFLIFIAFTTFGLMNVIIGVIVENTMDVANDTETDLRDLEIERKLLTVDKVREACIVIDEDGNDFVDIEEMAQGLSDPQIAQNLDDLELPLAASPQELFDLLDTGGEGKVSTRKFVQNMVRVVEDSQNARLSSIQMGINQIHRRIRGLRTSGNASSGGRCADSMLRSPGGGAAPPHTCPPLHGSRGGSQPEAFALGGEDHSTNFNLQRMEHALSEVVERVVRLENQQEAQGMEFASKLDAVLDALKRRGNAARSG